jgi:hypothetical protein
MHAPRKKAWYEKFDRSGYFLGALLLHLIIFLMIASWVIWKAPPAPHEEVFNGVAVKVPPPPVQPPSSGSKANNPNLEPAKMVVPVVAPMTTITTSNTSAFKMDTSTVLSHALARMSSLPAQGSGITPGGGGGSATGIGYNPLGSATGTDIQFTGYFWDLKETADKKPMEPEMVSETWRDIAQKFVNGGWHDQDLRRYYRSPAPLYTNCFAISARASEEAPHAFNLTGVDPGLWLIHYKATVIPPEDGDYTFVGFGDDLLTVRIDGHIVLDAGIYPMTNEPDLHKLYPCAWDHSAGQGRSRIGRHFHVQGGQPVDMDVLIGDRGENITFFLLLEKEGETYETMNDAPATASVVSSYGANFEVVKAATPKLPIFMLNSTKMPPIDEGDIPPMADKVVTWQGAPPSSSGENQ